MFYKYVQNLIKALNYFLNFLFLKLVINYMYYVNFKGTRKFMICLKSLLVEYNYKYTNI